MHDILALLRVTNFPAACRQALIALQVNLAYRCNPTILSEPGPRPMKPLINLPAASPT
jgi:hypothetical protein